jgi:glycosyltransferase involved in cell wall biosynthesis
MQFEHDLRALFDQAPADADAARFAARVDRRIVSRQRMAAGLISVLGLAGLAIAFLMFRPSLGELDVGPSILSPENLLASAGDIGELAQAVRRLQENPALLEELGKNARNAVGQFDRETVLSRFLSWIKEAVTGGKNAQP